jgi:hypothetical protein
MADQTSSDHAGSGTFSAEELPLIGGRAFWIYDGPLPAGQGPGPEAFEAAFSELEREFDPGGGGPIGLCVPVDPAEAERHPEAMWGDAERVHPEELLIYAGYLPDGKQARIRYFWTADVGPGLPNSPSMEEIERTDYSLGDRYLIEPLSQSDRVTNDDVLALWAAEGIVPEDEARRRVHEVLMAAIDQETGLAGVSTVYLQRNAQLGMDLWHYRTYVGPAHRHGQLAIQLLWHSRDHLKERYLSGEDTRASGMVMEVENQGLRMYFNKAYWLYSDFTFIGENERGDHVRVHYFPGAEAPPRSA